MCGETIEVSELRCPNCHELFTSAEPLTPEEIKAKLSVPEQSSTCSTGAIIICIYGLLGVTAPLNLLAGGIWYMKNRTRLRETSPLHHLLALVGLMVSALFRC
jgi:hypothetical protein